MFKNRDHLGKIIDITDTDWPENNEPGPLVPGVSEPIDDVSPEFLLLVSVGCTVGAIVLACAAWRWMT